MRDCSKDTEHFRSFREFQCYWPARTGVLGAYLGLPCNDATVSAMISIRILHASMPRQWRMV